MKKVESKFQNDGIAQKGNGVGSSGGFTKQQGPTKVQPNIAPKDKRSSDLKLNNQASQQNQQKENYFNEQLKAQMSNLVTNLNKQEKRLDEYAQDPKCKAREEYTNDISKQQLANPEKHEIRIGKEEKPCKIDPVLQSNVSTTATERSEAKPANPKNAVRHFQDNKKQEMKKNVPKIETPEVKIKPNLLKKEDEQK